MGVGPVFCLCGPCPCRACGAVAWASEPGPGHFGCEHAVHRQRDGCIVAVEWRHDAVCVGGGGLTTIWQEN